MKLTICIATINSRKAKFDHLVKYLNETKIDEVEIISICDNKEMNIGYKRNLLLQQAKGEYVAFIDDDDMVPNNYFTKIFEGINKDVDCIGFLVRLTGWASYPIICSLSNQWGGWYSDVAGFKYVRCPNHLSPMKREIALEIGYPNDKRTGEDADFSLRLKASGLIKSEHMINEVMYEYQFKNEPNKY